MYSMQHDPLPSKSLYDGLSQASASFSLRIHCGKQLSSTSGVVTQYAYA